MIYGNLANLTFTASASPLDVTNISLFGETSLATADAYASDPYSLMQCGASYDGSTTLLTVPTGAAAAPVPAEATPDSIAAAAQAMVGQVWNEDGCWLLASTIAARAGAGLPVQSTSIGTPGAGNGEWYVAYNGPAGATGQFQSILRAGDIIAFQTSSGGGHITTCVSGAGASAMLIDNIAYENASGGLQNSANDGSANDLIIAAAHPASQEFTGVNDQMAVVYRLDTPVVTAASADVTFGTASEALNLLASAADPEGKAVTGYQFYDSGNGGFVTGSGTVSAHSAAAAISSSSLAAVSFAFGSGSTSDTIDLRAFNGTYWGDWQSIVVTGSGDVTVPSSGALPPVVSGTTQNQTWQQGSKVSLALSSTLFTDPQKETLTYTATLTNGAALPSWLSFSSSTHSFTGTVPAGLENFTVMVTATDTSGLSASQDFTVNVPAAAPVANVPLPAQQWIAGQTIDDQLPANLFSDPQGSEMWIRAYQTSGAWLPSWLTFNASQMSFLGTAPSTPATVQILLLASDMSTWQTTTETLTASVVPGATSLALDFAPHDAITQMPGSKPPEVSGLYGHAHMLPQDFLPLHITM
jgi:hypothetical protein